jgi:predicted transposase/invertase (TIGR01784 family)
MSKGGAAELLIPPSTPTDGLVTDARMNNHNNLFQAWISAPEAAGLLFSEQLPERVFALFEPGPPELVMGSFVDDRLKKHRTDLLYRVKLKDGGEAYVYVLVEHKSSSDRLTPMQLLRYMVNIWSRLIDEGARPPLPPIIPLVFHHGAESWSAARTFHGLFEPFNDAFRSMTPQFDYVLIDLGLIEDEKLSRDLRQRAHLAAFKYTPRPDMREVGLPRVVRLFHALTELEILRLLHYIYSQHDDIGGDDLDRALRECAPQRKDRIMQGFYQEIMAKGKAEGRAEGKAETLLKLLSHRFGRLPAEVKRRVHGADAETLDRWALRILDAASLNDVIAN